MSFRFSVELFHSGFVRGHIFCCSCVLAVVLCGTISSCSMSCVCWCGISGISRIVCREFEGVGVHLGT